MDWFAAVDIYCERTGPGLWAEPLNAVSNLSFIAAALWGGFVARSAGNRSFDAWLLIWMAGLIGIGSGLFHTFAQAWAELADTIPIWSFVAAFVLVALHRFAGLAWGRVALWSVGVVAVAFVTVFGLASGPASSDAVAPVAADPLNGSGQYAPAVVALLAFALFTTWRRHPASSWLWAGLATFLISLTFRTLDRDLCSAWPQGTHFVWHLLNGLLIGLLLQMLVRTGYPAAPAARRR